MICKVCKEEIVNPKGKVQKRKKFCSNKCADINASNFQTFYWHSHAKWVPRNYIT